MGHGAGVPDDRRDCTLTLQQSLAHHFLLLLGKPARLDQEIHRRIDDLLHVVRIQIQQTASFGDGAKK